MTYKGQIELDGIVYCFCEDVANNRMYIGGTFATITSSNPTVVNALCFGCVSNASPYTAIQITDTNQEQGVALSTGNASVRCMALSINTTDIPGVFFGGLFDGTGPDFKTTLGNLCIYNTSANAFQGGPDYIPPGPSSASTFYTNGNVTSMVNYTDAAVTNYLMVGGEFTTFGDSNLEYCVIYNTSFGYLDKPTYNNTQVINGPVYNMTFSNTEMILIYGTFTVPFSYACYCDTDNNSLITANIGSLQPTFAPALVPNQNTQLYCSIASKDMIWYASSTTGTPYVIVSNTQGNWTQLGACNFETAYGCAGIGYSTVATYIAAPKTQIVPGGLECPLTKYNPLNELTFANTIFTPTYFDSTGTPVVLPVAGGSAVYTITSTTGLATVTSNSSLTTLDFLAVGGGGGGGGSGFGGPPVGGGGGGGGGILTTNVNLTAGTSYPIGVGLGGIGGQNVVVATNGGNTFLGNSIAVGGGSGGPMNEFSPNGNDGGCGGGAGISNGPYTPSGGAGSQGGDGADTVGSGNPQQSTSGGGGGAGASATDENGAAGSSYSITGVPIVYAGGGGGVGLNYSSAPGGAGGGGSSGSPGTNGVDGLGGGGGASNTTDANGGNGGNGGYGILIIKITT